MSGAIGDLHSYLSVMRLIDSTPSLLAAYLSCVHEQDDEIIQLFAKREGWTRPLTGDRVCSLR